MSKKILFPTDFSEQSIRALQETVALNNELDFELIILHAYSRPYSEGFHQQESLEKLEKKIDHQFGKLEKQIPMLAKQQYKIKKQLGDAIEIIVSLVDKESFDLIAMSTKGAVGVGELFGTKTAKIIKSVNVPVLVIPKDAKLVPIKKIGLACDYSAITKKGVLDLLVHLAERVEVGVDLITLNRDEKTMTKEELSNRDELLKTMKNLPVELVFTQHPHVSSGLISYARDHELSVVGVIPKSYNYIERVFHESLTQSMAFHSPVPVLVLQ